MFDKYYLESRDIFEVKKKTTLELKLNPDSCGEKRFRGKVPAVRKHLLLQISNGTTTVGHFRMKPEQNKYTLVPGDFVKIIPEDRKLI